MLHNSFKSCKSQQNISKTARYSTYYAKSSPFYLRQCFLPFKLSSLVLTLFAEKPSSEFEGSKFTTGLEKSVGSTIIVELVGTISLSCLYGPVKIKMIEINRIKM